MCPAQGRCSMWTGQRAAASWSRKPSPYYSAAPCFSVFSLWSVRALRQPRRWWRRLPSRHPGTSMGVAEQNGCRRRKRTNRSLLRLRRERMHQQRMHETRGPSRWWRMIQCSSTHPMLRMRTALTKVVQACTWPSALQSMMAHLPRVRAGNNLQILLTPSPTTPGERSCKLRTVLSREQSTQPTSRDTPCLRCRMPTSRPSGTRARGTSGLCEPDRRTQEQLQKKLQSKPSTTSGDSTHMQNTDGAQSRTRELHRPICKPKCKNKPRGAATSNDQTYSRESAASRSSAASARGAYFEAPCNCAAAFALEKTACSCKLAMLDSQ